MTSFLIAFTEDHPEGLKIPLDGPQVLVGRDPRCNFRPPVELVSKLHCAFLVDESGVTLRDLKSTNGTFVNGHRIAEAVALNDGDQIRIATLPATFRRFAAKTGAAAAPTVGSQTVMLEKSPIAAPRPAPIDPNFDPLAYLFDVPADADMPATVAEVVLPQGPASADTAVVATALTDTVASPAANPAPAAPKKDFGDTRKAATDALARYMSPRRNR